PSTREEAWRWADPEAIAAAAAMPVSDVVHEPATLLLDLPGARLVFIDGRLDDTHTKLGAVTLRRIAAGDHALGQRATGDGWALDIAAHAAADPVQIVHLATGNANHLPAEIILADGASAEVVETYVGSGWQNRFTRLTLGQGARLQRSVRLLQAGGFNSIRDEASLAANAHLDTAILGAGDAGTRIDAQLVLAGDGGFVDYGGALLTRRDGRQECAVRVRHAAPNGGSRQIWRAVAADQSTASLAAAVEVARHAQKTDGVQSLRGLLLKRTATVNLKPELEIFADDVKCAHGATVGELDARALFYMESRGIPPARAQALLTRAFVADAIDRIGNEAVRDAFAADADAWLETAL
ncbi:MAG TPA: SufD family Fe-S cluster assembly protein, partial [Sphingomonas sp.]